MLATDSSILRAARATQFGRFMRIAISFAIVPAVTWLSFQVHLNLTSTSLLQLLAVLAIALRVGFWPAAAASILANLCLNYFFVPPIFSLYIADRQNWIAISVFEISALVVSRLSTQAREQASRALSREKEVERLYLFSRQLLQLSGDDSYGRGIVELMQRVFSLDSAVLLDAFDGRVHKAGVDGVEDLAMETRAAYLRRVDADHADNATVIRILTAMPKPLGAIGLRGNPLADNTANALASLISISLERVRALDRESQAEAERKTEQLRTTVLDALAHEYKTPLTALRAAATGLVEIGGLQPVQLKLATLIDSEVGRLNSLTTRLLRMSKLDSSKVHLKCEIVDTGELVREVTAGMEDVLFGHEFQVQDLDGQVLVKADRELVSMALTQLLDNAAKHSHPSSPITVSVSATPSEVCLSVHNFGPVIPQEERGRIFQRFYRGSSSTSQKSSTGLGLSISRKVAHAHHGRVWVTSGAECGNTFALVLPRHDGVRGV